MLHRFNVWFDKLPEPRRFGIFVGIMLGWWLPLLVADMINPPLSLPFRIIGVMWLIAVVIIALSRLYPGSDK